MVLYVSAFQALLSVVRLAHSAYITYWERSHEQQADKQRHRENSLASLCVPDEHFGEVMALGGYSVLDESNNGNVQQAANGQGNYHHRKVGTRRRRKNGTGSSSSSSGEEGDELVETRPLQHRRSKWRIAVDLRACQKRLHEQTVLVGMLQHRPQGGAVMLYRLEAVVRLAIEASRHRTLLQELDESIDDSDEP
jgi:hypothetical protein